MWTTSLNILPLKVANSSHITSKKLHHIIRKHACFFKYQDNSIFQNKLEYTAKIWCEASATVILFWKIKKITTWIAVTWWTVKLEMRADTPN